MARRGGSVCWYKLPSAKHLTRPGAARSSHTRPDPRHLTASLLAPISLFTSPSSLFDPHPAPRRHQERTTYTKLTNYHPLHTSMSRNSAFDPPSEAAETGSSLRAAVSGLLNKSRKLQNSNTSAQCPAARRPEPVTRCKMARHRTFSSVGH